MGWWTTAACRGWPTRLWYVGTSSQDRVERELALTVCRDCPVCAECLAAALDEELVTEGVPSGIRGGVSAGARATMLAARHRDRVVAVA